MWTEHVLNGFVDEMSRHLSGGSLVIYDGDGTFTEPLVRIVLPVPAFPIAEGAKTVARALPPSVIDRTGEARRAQLLTATGEVLANLTVKATDAVDADEADVLVDRTDFHRGGICQVSQISLRLQR